MDPMHMVRNGMMPDDVRIDAEMQSCDFDHWKEPDHPEWPGFMTWTAEQDLFRSRALWRGWKARGSLPPLVQLRSTPELKAAADIFASGGL